MVSPEALSLKYSFPCAHVLLQMGTMDEERYSELERAAKSGEMVSRDILEESFPAAFRRIKKLANDMRIEDYWDIKVVKEYWHNAHNILIDKGDGNYAKFPESFRDYCKVHVAEVREILPQGFLMVRYGEKKRPVSGDYISDIKVGEKVRIHHAYAIERFEE